MQQITTSPAKTNLLSMEAQTPADVLYETMKKVEIFVSRNRGFSLLALGVKVAPGQDMEDLLEFVAEAYDVAETSDTVIEFIMGDLWLATGWINGDTLNNMLLKRGVAREFRT